MNLARVNNYGLTFINNYLTVTNNEGSTSVSNKVYFKLLMPVVANSTHKHVFKIYIIETNRIILTFLLLVVVGYVIKLSILIAH